MALSPNYQARLKSLRSAAKDLELAMAENLSQFTPRQQDLLRNGQVQKFEFCNELLWKVFKLYLYEKRGIDEVAPKSVIKAFYRSDGISVEDFEQLIRMVEDRNILSHVYSETEFFEIHSHLPLHVKTIQRMVDFLIKNSA